MSASVQVAAVKVSAILTEVTLSQHLDAFDDPPTVCAFEGEILINGPLAHATYTPKAARALISRLQAAIEEIDSRPVASGRGAGAGTVPLRTA